MCNILGENGAGVSDVPCRAGLVAAAPAVDAVVGEVHEAVAEACRARAVRHRRQPTQPLLMQVHPSVGRKGSKGEGSGCAGCKGVVVVVVVAHSSGRQFHRVLFCFMGQAARYAALNTISRLVGFAHSIWRAQRMVSPVATTGTLLWFCGQRFRFKPSTNARHSFIIESF